MAKRKPCKDQTPVGQRDIDSIPVGTWEAENIPCPPPCDKTPQTIWRLIRREEEGNQLQKIHFHDLKK